MGEPRRHAPAAAAPEIDRRRIVLAVREPAVAATVVPVTVVMRSGAGVALFVGVTLIQCYATRTGEGCAPLSEHATMAECRKLASAYQKFDTRDLRVKGVPAVVSYHCVAAKPGASR